MDTKLRHLLAGLVIVILLTAVVVVTGARPDWLTSLRQRRSPTHHDESPSNTVSPLIKPSITHSPTATPPIRDQRALVVIDCTGIQDQGLKSRITHDINAEHGTQGVYYAGERDQLAELVEQALADGWQPDLVLGPADQIDDLTLEWDSITPYMQSLELNPGANKLMRGTLLPVAIMPYGYYVRTDLMPEDFHAPDLYRAAKTLRDPSGRYGFGVAAPYASALWLHQMDTAIATMDDDANIEQTVTAGPWLLHKLWYDSMIPPDIGYWDDLSAVTAYLRDACAIVYANGQVWEALVEYPERLAQTRFIPHLDQPNTMGVRLLALSVTRTADEAMIQTYLQRMYRVLDDVIIRENPSLLHPGLSVSSSPFFGDILDGAYEFIVYSSEMDAQWMEQILFRAWMPDERVQFQITEDK